MSEDLRQHVVILLRELRQRRGLGLEDVQDLTGQLGWPVSRSRLSMVERGETDLRLSDLYALSRSYGMSLADMIAESLVAHGKKKFSPELSAQELFEEAKRLFNTGFPLEAAWAFDESGRRADAADKEFIHLCMISAGHCYERAGAIELALRRVEKVVDHAEEGSDVYLRAVGKAAVLRARAGSMGRSAIYAGIVEEHLNHKELSIDLRAFLLGARAAVLFRTSLIREAHQSVLDSGRAYRKVGNFDMTAKQFATASLYALRLGRPRTALRIAQDARGYVDSSTEVETRLLVDLAVAEALFATG
ncbi:MAG: helix-turn-helix transcriptional regulator, partial [Acidobacteriota bacterium]